MCIRDSIYMKQLIALATLILLLFNCNNREVISYVQQIFDPDKGMIYIPAGEFIMGSDTGKPDQSPAHIVYLDAYYIDENPVTNEEYLKFWEAPDGGNKSKFTPEDFPNDPWPERAYRKPRHPVVGVSWIMARKYAQWAGKRLPTEAEWEKAAKGNTQRKYPWGDTPPEYQGKFRANFNTIYFAKDGFSTTSPVGFYNGKNLNTASGRSPYELNDMAGNVWEWVKDWYSPEYYKKSPYKNPEGPIKDDSNGKKVIRGGSWKNTSEEIITTYRKSMPIDAPFPTGFPAKNRSRNFRCPTA